MSERPKVSVCVTAFNRASYLGLALQSALGQTLRDLEVIVYDDGSTDHTSQVIAGFNDPRLRYFRQSRTVGLSANRNSCLSVARGQYIAWLDADDVYLPAMLETQSGVLDRHGNVGLVHGAYHVIDGEGRRLRDWSMPFEADTIERGEDAFRELVISNYVTVPTVMIRRECYDRVGSHAVDLGNSEDWEMWMRIALHADLAFSATPVAQYRQHESNMSSSVARSGEQLRSDIAVVERIFSRYSTLIPDATVLGARTRAALASKAILLSRDAVTLGNRAAAIRFVVQALRLVPGLRRHPSSQRLIASIRRCDEYAHYTSTREFLQQLYPDISGTRLGNRVMPVVQENSSSQMNLRRTAETVQRVTPDDAVLATVSKWDPTLLHLSERRGGNFPDRRLLPAGYPSDSGSAIAHLEQLRTCGTQYLVFPDYAFWWLEHYREFGYYLDQHCRRVWADDRCLIYRLDVAI